MTGKIREPVPQWAIDEAIGPGFDIRIKDIAQFDLVRSNMSAALGCSRTDDQWLIFFQSANDARREFIFNQPPTLDSRRRMEALASAASLFRSAFREVLEHQHDPEPIPSRPQLDRYLEGDFCLSLWDLRDFFNADRSEDALNDAVVEYVAKIEKAANRILNHAKQIKRGEANKITGYDEFLAACVGLWGREINSLDCRKVGGKWKGRFVDFVAAAQPFLPSKMRRRSANAIGAAIDSWVSRYRGGYGKTE